MVETTHCTDEDSADISLHQSIGTREMLERMKNLRGPLYRLGLENGMNGNLEMPDSYRCSHAGHSRSAGHRSADLCSLLRQQAPAIGRPLAAPAAG